jgi:hypothetical protein
MYFEDLYEIYNKSAIRNYYPPDIIPSPRFRVRIDAAIEAVSVTWQDGNNKRITRTTSTHSVTETEVDLTGEGVYGNLDASRRRGFGELMRSYQGTFTGQATVQGDGLLQANEVVNFYNFHSSPFRMVIARATHSFNRNGWRTALDLWRRPSFVDI